MGVGQFRGGLGVRRTVRMVGPTEVISMKKKSKTVGWGLDGGQPSPVKNHMVLRPGTAREQAVGVYRETLETGERFVNYSAGGAGWGDPALRDPEASASDLANGFVTNPDDPKKGDAT